MEIAKYTVLVPIRVVHNVFAIYLENLGYCAEGLSNLDRGTCEQEVIFVDYGSTPPFAEKIKAIADAHKFQCVYAAADTWSRGRALNVGILRATGDRVFMIDADTLLPKQYALENIAAATDTNYTVTLVYDSFEKEKKCGSADAMKKLPGKIRAAGWSHIGASRKWLVDNNGYNPDYVCWGGEDDDIILRMAVQGITRCQLQNNPVHLWHPQYGELMGKIGQRDVYEKHKQENKKRYFNFRKKVQGK